MMEALSIEKRLKRILKLRGLTQKQVSKKLNITEQSLSRMLRDETLSATNLNEIMISFEINCSEIWEGADQPISEASPEELIAKIADLQAIILHLKNDKTED